MDGGVPRQNILYLNFFDDRLYNLRQDKLGLILEAYYSLYYKTKTGKEVDFIALGAAEGQRMLVQVRVLGRSQDAETGDGRFGRGDGRVESENRPRCNPQ